ncbi:branched-chain amino acid transport system II carrier protein [Erysipelotrichaceae bacterium RD49]|nr:branched-chain amino acid transport system II carrier protein [Erysipelotrichaceae bacterium RD49]
MNRKIILLGITLFSMFFGAGNLIFAPFLGAQAGSSMWLALSGMLLTSVVMPVCSICIIAPYGNASNLISRIYKPLGPIFMTLVYLLIGPCIAIPRTASTALEMWTWLLPGKWMPILAVMAFFGAAYLMAVHPGKLKDILGKVMGPILLVLILFVSIPLLFRPANIVAPSSLYAASPFFTGLNEGYQTMDILAAFCFGIIITMNIKKMQLANPQKALAQSAIVAGILLASVYILLAFCSARNSADLQGLSNGAQILSTAAMQTWGSFGQILCGLIFLIACLNVCSGLLACCSEYFEETFSRFSYRTWLMIFTIAGTLTACSGLDSILSWSGKLLSLICPIAILILAIGLFNTIKDRKAHQA